MTELSSSQGLWSGIIFASSDKNFHDPASRFRVLAKHRCGRHKCVFVVTHKILLDFCATPSQSQALPTGTNVITDKPLVVTRDFLRSRFGIFACLQKYTCGRHRSTKPAAGQVFESCGHKFLLASKTRDPTSRRRAAVGTNRKKCHWHFFRVCARSGYRSQIILSPSLQNFRDPGSVFLHACKNIPAPFNAHAKAPLCARSGHRTHIPCGTRF